LKIALMRSQKPAPKTMLDNLSHPGKIRMVALTSTQKYFRLTFLP
jgi:hypothetical protein